MNFRSYFGSLSLSLPHRGSISCLLLEQVSTSDYLMALHMYYLTGHTPGMGHSELKPRCWLLRALEALRKKWFPCQFQLLEATHIS